MNLNLTGAEANIYIVLVIRSFPMGTHRTGYPVYHSGLLRGSVSEFFCALTGPSERRKHTICATRFRYTWGSNRLRGGVRLVSLGPRAKAG